MILSLQVTRKLLQAAHTDVFINMVEDIIRKVRENPDVIPTVSIVTESKGALPPRSPSSTRRKKDDATEATVRKIIFHLKRKKKNY